MPYLSATGFGLYNDINNAQKANEGLLYYYTYTCLQGSGQLKDGDFISCNNPNQLTWTGMADDKTRQSVTFTWANMDHIRSLQAYKTAAVCRPSHTHEKILLEGSGIQEYLKNHGGNPDGTLDVVDTGEGLCPWNSQTGGYVIDIYTGVGEDAFNATIPLWHLPVEVYIVSFGE